MSSPCAVALAFATGDHQTANARALTEAGAAILVPESKFEVDALSAQIETVLSNPDGAAQMAQAALSVGKPDATDALVALVEELADARRK